MTSQMFELKNLSCPSCIMHLEAMEDDLAGVTKVEADYKRQTMRVEYDQAHQSPGGIMEAVAVMGYIATPVEGADNAGQGGSRWKKLFR